MRSGEMRISRRERRRPTDNNAAQLVEERQQPQQRLARHRNLGETAEPTRTCWIQSHVPLPEKLSISG